MVLIIQIPEGNDFERENYMSNRDVKIHKKIVPTTDSVVNIQKEITNRKKERDNERTKEEKELIVFLLIMLILLSVVAIIIFL